MDGIINSHLAFSVHLFVRFTLTTVPSPCINWCDINPENTYCRGCFRTLNEIASWSELSDQEKLAVWSELEMRKPQTSQ